MNPYFSIDTIHQQVNDSVSQIAGYWNNHWCGHVEGKEWFEEALMQKSWAVTTGPPSATSYKYVNNKFIRLHGVKYINAPIRRACMFFWGFLQVLCNFQNRLVVSGSQREHGKYDWGVEREFLTQFMSFSCFFPLSNRVGRKNNNMVGIMSTYVFFSWLNPVYVSGATAQPSCAS